MSEIAKQQSLIMELKSRLQKRLPSWTFTESMDDSGMRLLASADATPAAGEQVLAIKFKMESTQFENSIGVAQKVFSPSVCQIIQEAGILSLVNQLIIDLEVSRMGVTQERFQNTAASVPAVSQFQDDGSVTGSTLIARIANDLYWPLSGQ